MKPGVHIPGDGPHLGRALAQTRIEKGPVHGGFFLQSPSRSPAVAVEVEFHFSRVLAGVFEVINGWWGLRVPGTDVVSGNSGDHRFVDHLDGPVCRGSG